ncbi:MAG: LemA family protein [Chlamydiae bacterium]|nr:LemA family protein [Chlamydiota bacterium]MBI3277938.1 LemA family protein [Chlamydiota bacterium]
MKISWIIIFLISVEVGWLYNRMIGLKKRAEGAWSDVDVQLKRRHDLIPSLVTCVQGYMQHERGTLTEVTLARQSAQGVHRVEEKGVSEQNLTQNLKSLILLSERYPELKANTTFLSLQEKLTDTENLIQNARRYYNAVVRDYNTLMGQFPHLIIAKIFHFQPLEFFELEEASEANAQKVNLL